MLKLNHSECQSPVGIEWTRTRLIRRELIERIRTQGIRSEIEFAYSQAISAPFGLDVVCCM